MGVLEEHYTISHGWKGKLYLGIDLDWDYAGRKVNLSILLYVKEVLIRSNHAMPRRLQDQPHPHIKLKYGQTVKYTEEKDSSTPLTAARREEKNITRSTWGFPLLWPRNQQHDAHHPWPYHQAKRKGIQKNSTHPRILDSSYASHLLYLMR